MCALTLFYSQQKQQQFTFPFSPIRFRIRFQQSRCLRPRFYRNTQTLQPQEFMHTYLHFCNAVSGQRSPGNTAPECATKTAYARHSPANPDFLKTLLLFNTSQCFLVKNYSCANSLSSPNGRFITGLLMPKAYQSFSHYSTVPTFHSFSRSTKIYSSANLVIS
jgi:hypothetical protein